MSSTLILRDNDKRYKSDTRGWTDECNLKSWHCRGLGGSSCRPSGLLLSDLYRYHGWKLRCVGGVFEHDVEQQVRAVLRQAVDDVNSNPRLMPGIRLQVDLEFTPAYDSFAASRAGKHWRLLRTHGGRNLIRGQVVDDNFLMSLTSENCRLVDWLLHHVTKNTTINKMKRTQNSAVRVPVIYWHLTEWCQLQWPIL